MKTLSLILIFIILRHDSIGQVSRIDSLIKQLDNSQVGFNGDYFGATIDLRGEPSISLYEVGKPSTEKLIAFLEDTTKGIIAHVILTWIWGKTERPRTIFIKRDTLSVYSLNDLNFFQSPGKVYANQYDLKLNRLRWLSFIKENSR